MKIHPSVMTNKSPENNGSKTSNFNLSVGLTYLINYLPYLRRKLNELLRELNILIKKGRFK